MKVIGYVWIEKTGYIGTHSIGIVCDDGEAYAFTKYVTLPKIGAEVCTTRIWNLRVDKYVPLTKLHRLLNGIENAD